MRNDSAAVGFFRVFPNPFRLYVVFPWQPNISSSCYYTKSYLIVTGLLEKIVTKNITVLAISKTVKWIDV